MTMTRWLCAVAFALGCRRSPAETAKTRDWAPVLQGHTVRDGAPAPRLAWTSPRGCTLTYEWIARMQTLPDPSMARGGIPVQGIEATGVAEGRGDDTGTWSLGVRWRALSNLAGEIRSPGGRDEGIAAAMLLRTDGRAWREQDGPTSTWSAYGTFPGLVRFFPTLPAATREGTTATWRYRVHARNAGVAVDMRRGGLRLPPGMNPPPPEGTDNEAHARLARWITVDGQPVAVIETTERKVEASEQTVPGVGTVSSQGERRSAGEHLVLASSGRLLFARYDDTLDLRTRMGGQTLAQRQTVHAELRLVGACDGPSLSSAIPLRAPEERALDAVVALRNAIASEDRPRILAALSPALRARHGDPALLSLLLRHAARHGPLAFGSPEVMQPGGVSRTPSGAWRIAMTGRAEHVGAEDRRLTVDTVMEVEVGAEGATVRRIQSSSVQGGAQDLLDVSSESLVSDVPP